MTETLILIAAAIVMVYLVDDGRIRVAAISALGALLFWRNRQILFDGSNSSDVSESADTLEIKPRPPNTEALDAEIADTDARLDAIDDARPSGRVGAGLDLLDHADRRRAGGDS